MNLWTPTLRGNLLGCIRSRPGSTNVQIAERMRELRLSWPCMTDHSSAKDWTDWNCNGTHDSGFRNWRVEEIYPHLTRMRQRGEIHSVYEPITITQPNGSTYQYGRDAKQHWYPGPRLPDMTDPDAVERWLEDRWESVDDDGLGQPAFEGLPL